MPNSGSCKFSVSYDYKKYSPTFTINLLYYCNILHFLITVTYVRYQEGVYCFLAGLSLPPDIKKTL